MLATGNGAFLIDLDGTLAETTGPQVRSWGSWAAERGLDASPFLDAVGMTHIAKIRRFAPHLDAHAEAADVAERELRDTREITALPGAMELLNSGYRMAIVTSAPRPLARLRLAAAGLPEPGIMVCADDVRAGKPDPEPYHRAAERLGVHPGRCTVFEDAPAGVASGLAAGAWVVALTTSVSADQLTRAHAIVPSIAVYLDLLETMPWPDRVAVPSTAFTR
jgi:sugar-phosphatase